MAYDRSLYGGDIMGSIRGHERGDTLLGRDRGAPLRPTGPTPTKPTKPTPPTNRETPRPRKPVDTKKKPVPIDKALNKLWDVPKLQVPTLLTPNLDVTPELQTAQLQDFNVTPIEIGALPTLEAAPDAAPTVRMPDRQDASIRRSKLSELAKMKQAKGAGSTLLSGKAGDLRRVATRKGM